MNNQEYEQKKQECWKEYKLKNLVGEVQWQPVSRYDVFCEAFDRAYALGKHEKDAEGEEMLTCDRDVVRMLYDGTDSVKVRQVLEGIFGSKCLPDELNEDNFAKSEPKPSEPKNEGTHQEQYVPKNAESGTHSLNHILKDGFREHNRLHIAAMAMQGILSNADRMKRYEYVATEPPCEELAVVVARNALRYADALIAECEKGGTK